MRGMRPAVKAIGDGVEVILTVDREVSALGQRGGPVRSDSLHTI